MGSPFKKKLTLVVGIASVLLLGIFIGRVNSCMRMGNTPPPDSPAAKNFGAAFAELVSGDVKVWADPDSPIPGSHLDRVEVKRGFTLAMIAEHNGFIVVNLEYAKKFDSKDKEEWEFYALVGQDRDFQDPKGRYWHMIYQSGPWRIFKANE